MSGSPREKPEVSVIVPVYNVEEYLPRCLDSLLAQSLESLEILVIDDGSADGSGRICEEYAGRDPRIRVIHQENAGLSAARNRGIELARGEFLMFADGDDRTDPEFCALPLALAREREADLILFQFRKTEDGRELRNTDRRIPEGEKTEEEAHRLLIDGVGFTVWNKLYHRDLFRENRFPEGRTMEDLALVPVLVHAARRIVYTGAVLYEQVRRPGSITTTRSPGNLRDNYDALVLTAENLKKWGWGRMGEEFLLTKLLLLAGKSGCAPEVQAACIRRIREAKACPASWSARERAAYRMIRFAPGLYRRLYPVYKSLRR